MQSGLGVSLDHQYSYKFVSTYIWYLSMDISFVIGLIMRLRHLACRANRWESLVTTVVGSQLNPCISFMQCINIKTSEWIQSLFCWRMLISCTLYRTERICHLTQVPQPDSWHRCPSAEMFSARTHSWFGAKRAKCEAGRVIGCGGKVFACVRHQANTWLPSTPTYIRHLPSIDTYLPSTSEPLSK